MDLGGVPAEVAGRGNARGWIVPTIRRAPGRGDGNRVLDPAGNGRVEAACDRIAGRGRNKISPALRATESQDPDRHLIGFDDRLKGRDRIKEKVSAFINDLNISPDEAVSLVHDTIRYTFQYKES